MSTEQFNKKINQATKTIAALRKDINYRQQQASRGQTTYSIDAEIRGQLTDLESNLGDLDKIVKNYEANPKDFNLNAKELQRRKGQYQKLVGDKNSLKRTYDSFFQKKASQEIASLTGQQTFKQKHNTNNLTAKQLADLKKQQQQDQDAALDDLINTVRNIKDGNKGINKELKQQQVLLDDLEDGIDDNAQRMGKTKRKMMKLLDKSSNCCLITTILVEIAAILCILLLW